MKNTYKPIVRPILTFGDPSSVLTQICPPLSQKEMRSDETQQRIADLVETLSKQEGLVGLAAPQIGWAARVIVVWVRATPNRPELKDTGKIVMVNPEFELVSQEMEIGYEGCGSLPGIAAKVERHSFITVTYNLYRGRRRNAVSKDFHDFAARVVQHEMDHLQGISFVDRAVEKSVITWDHFVRIREEERQLQQ
jgi:peptide deformylase